MRISVSKDSKELGEKAAHYCREVINKAIIEKGSARIILSTGASQFDTIKALVKEKIDWSRVEMFHLDEYAKLSEDHKASFRRYLKERFTSKINLGKAYFVNGEGDLQKNIEYISKEIDKKPVDLALIGIGENAHIAFNDPPADFDVEVPFIIVDLDEDCKKQQVREGWFESINEVPDKAITMTAKYILKSKVIISAVPYKVKAKAIKSTLENNITNMIPATILKGHKNWSLFLDKDSSSLTDKSLLEEV